MHISYRSGLGFVLVWVMMLLAAACEPDTLGNTTFQGKTEPARPGLQDAGVLTDAPSYDASNRDADPMLTVENGDCLKEAEAVCRLEVAHYVGSNWQRETISWASGVDGESITAAFAQCDRGRLCFVTERGYHCTTNQDPGNTWTFEPWGDALQSYAPTFAIATGPNYELWPSRLHLSAGNRWWTYYANTDGSLGTADIDFRANGRGAYNEEWRSEPNAPSTGAFDVVADWYVIDEDGSAVWYFLRENGLINRRQNTPSGQASWLPAGNDFFGFGSQSAPSAANVRGAAIDCRGGLFVL